MSANINIHHVAHIVVGVGHQSISLSFPNQKIYDKGVEWSKDRSVPFNDLSSNMHGADSVTAFVGEDILGGLENLRADVDRAIREYKAKTEVDNG